MIYHLPNMPIEYSGKWYLWSVKVKIICSEEINKPNIPHVSYAVYLQIHENRTNMKKNVLLRNILAVVAGIVIGGVVNMGDYHTGRLHTSTTWRS